MKPKLSCAFLCILGIGLAWVNPILASEKLLLPGLTYYQGPENLTGKLVFCLTDRNAPIQSSASQSTIFEFDLKSKKLSSVTRAPGEIFVASPKGDLYCTLMDNLRGTNAFVYSTKTHKSRTIELSSPPVQTTFVGEHAFFVVEHPGGSRIVEYMADSDTTGVVTLPNASSWEREVYSDTHAPPGTSNVLHFNYAGHGSKKVDGQDYQTGYYSLDLVNRKSQRIALSDEDRDAYQAANGRYVYFKGDDGPDKGRTLVSSTHPKSTDDNQQGENKDVKLLHNFAITSLFGGADYWIYGLSPNHEFVFVKYGSIGRADSVCTYFIVNATTGQTRVLLKDTVSSAGGGFMSEVYWVASE